MFYVNFSFYVMCIMLKMVGIIGLDDENIIVMENVQFSGLLVGNLVNF